VTDLSLSGEPPARKTREKEKLEIELKTVKELVEE